MSERVYDKDIDEIVARPGEAFVVELAGQPGGGYVWALDIDRDDVECAEMDATDSTSSIGGSDRQRFRITPGAAGTATIVMWYGRPWESEPDERRSVRLTVRDDG
ncbi:MAG: protease inhibitor I42 family protein [Ilumatobacter sp.]|nr:protease inhibitor I42 family protein [Ilumatobacter sp.]